MFQKPYLQYAVLIFQNLGLKYFLCFLIVVSESILVLLMVLGV